MRLRFFAFITLLIVTASALPAAAQTGAQQPAPTPSPQRSTTSTLVGSEWFTAGTNALDIGDYDAAILNFSLVTLFNPTFSQAYFGRALGYLGRDDIDRALTDTTRAIETAPNNPTYRAALLATRADIHRQRDDFPAAIEDYSAALELDETTDYYASRALLYVAEGDFDRALADLTSALELDSDQAALYLYRAYALTQMGRAQEAAPDYLEFILRSETRSVDGGELVSGQPVVATITRGTVYHYTFEGAAGDRVTVRAEGRPGDPIDPLVVLADSEGSPLAADDDSGGGFAGTDARIRDFELPEDGTYRIIVSHSLGGFQGQIAVGIFIRPAQ